MTTKAWTAARRPDWAITLVCDVGVWAVALAVATLFRLSLIHI